MSMSFKTPTNLDYWLQDLRLIPLLFLLLMPRDLFLASLSRQECSICSFQSFGLKVFLSFISIQANLSICFHFYFNQRV
jgi:hypothetical protein